VFLVLSLFLIQFNSNILHTDLVDNFDIMDNPVVFEYSASTSGFLSVVVRSSEPNTDLTLFAKGPNCFFLDIPGSSYDSDVEGYTGYEQAIFNIPGSGKYYIVISPYSQLGSENNVEILSWFYPSDDFIDDKTIPIIEERTISDLENIHGSLNSMTPLAIFNVENFDNNNNLLIGSVEASEDVMLEVYDGDNPIDYVFQSDQDLDGNAGNEEIVFFSKTSNPIFVLRAYDVITDNEIFYDFNIELFKPEEEIHTSEIYENYIDPENGIDKIIYYFDAPSQGIYEINLRGEEGDLILQALSPDSSYYSDIDYDGNAAFENLILQPGIYYIIVSNHPESYEPADFALSIISHEDKDASRDNALELTLGEKTFDTLSVVNFDYIDYYSFTSKNDGEYLVEVIGTEFIGDLILTVEDMDGNIIETSDQDFNGDYTNELIVVNLDEGNKIYINVTPYMDEESIGEDCPYSIIVIKE